MRGEMIWFNVDKGFGFVRSEDGERLYVDADGFAPGSEPAARCAGRIVEFERREGESGGIAASVRYTVAASPQRARLRRSR
jgi:cold shock CspA family protein